MLVNWGDGSPVESVTVNQSADTFTGDHVYATGGVFIVTVTAVDDDGGASVNVLSSAVVQGVGLVDGTLYIIGTDGRDHVDLKFNEKKDQLKVDVKLNQAGSDGGSDGGGDHIKQTFAISEIDRIVAYLCGGDDHYIGGSDGGSDGGVDAAISQFVFGGAGNDHIHGSQAVDMIDGGEGNDRIYGRRGDDVIVDLAGNNRIHGGSGNDTITTGDGDDDIDGNQGDDIIHAGHGRNKVDGGHGNDIVVGGAGNDCIEGDQGNDLLIGGTGRDRMEGGHGNDLIVASSAANDNDLAALQAALAHWTSGDLVAALVDLGAITDDLDKDDLEGEQGLDELIGGIGDKLKQSSELTARCRAG